MSKLLPLVGMAVALGGLYAITVSAKPRKVRLEPGRSYRIVTEVEPRLDVFQAERLVQDVTGGAKEVGTADIDVRQGSSSTKVSYVVTPEFVGEVTTGEWIAYPLDPKFRMRNVSVEQTAKRPTV